MFPNSTPRSIAGLIGCSNDAITHHLSRLLPYGLVSQNAAKLYSVTNRTLGEVADVLNVKGNGEELDYRHWIKRISYWQNTHREEV